MIIGIDFDNTIARYDTLFRKVAMEEGIIDGNWEGKGKTELRDHLRRQPNGEKTWMKLQGLVYGKYMDSAEMMPGVANFLMSCNVRDHKIFIVSHKTEFGHFDPEKISLRKEAMKWMQIKRFFDSQNFGINKDNIHFANTREEKVDKIYRERIPQLVNSDNTKCALMETLILRYLERIADHAVFMSDAVNYIVTGKHKIEPSG